MGLRCEVICPQVTGQEEAEAEYEPRSAHWIVLFLLTSLNIVFLQNTPDTK